MFFFFNDPATTGIYTLSLRDALPILEAGRQILDAASRDSSLEGLELKFGDDWTERPDESGSVMVGDRGVDMSAAARYGVRGLLCDSDTGLADVIDSILGGSA